MGPAVMLPDKRTYKTTVTNELRADLISLIESKSLQSYLEIGCDCGYTMMSVAASGLLRDVTGIDIDPNRARACQRNLRTVPGNFTVQIVSGTSVDIPQKSYDLVLIDADHTYEGVKRDFEQVMVKNLAPAYFVVFHDYGLSGYGVKKFIGEQFESFTRIGMEKGWNPLGGPTNDWEAALVTIGAR